MTTTRRFTSCMAVLFAVGMGVSACGGSGGGETTSKDAGSTSKDSSDNGGTPDAGPSEDGGVGGGAKSVKEEFQSQGNQAKCDGNNPPSRCNVTGTQMASFDQWATASALTDLQVSSDEAKKCCYDMDKGEEMDDIDNVLSGLLDLLSSRFNADEEIDKAIKEGEFVLVTEHEGLDDLKNDDEFKINFYLAEYGEQVDGKPSNGTKVELNPASFDKGVQAEAQVAPAKVENGSIEGGPGQVSLSFNIPQVGKLALDVNGAKIEGDINASKSELGGKGVVIENGKLGGYVRLRDVADSVNGILQNCGCLNNPNPQSNPVLEVENSNTDDPDLCPPSKPDCDEPLTCGTDSESGKEFATLSENNCSEDEDGQVCTFVSDVCGLNPGQILKGQTDLDTDGDGTPDAVSIGAIFEMTGAQIQGAAPYMSVLDQDVGSSVSVSRAHHDAGFWAVVHKNKRVQKEEGDGKKDAPGAILGKKKFEAGDHQDVSVSLDQGLSNSVDGDSAKLWLMLHADKGEKGTFEFGSDTKTDAPVQDGRGNVVQTKFTAQVK